MKQNSISFYFSLYQNVPTQTKYGNDMIGEIHTGALSPVNPNGDAMNWTCSWTTAQGLECLGVQHFLRQQVLS